MKINFTHRLGELMDNHKFHSENLEESTAVIGITMETKTLMRLQKPMQLQPSHIISVNWMAEKENSFVKGSVFADNCGTSKARPCCTLDILFAILTIIRL